MVIHAASMFASFVGTVGQVPVSAGCPQAAPEPEWRFWISALAPWIGPLISGMVSIYVAWKVFRWQGNKDHRQWILENKKSEWQELITLAAEIERHMPSVGIGGELIDAVKGSSLDRHLRQMTQATLRCVFAASVLGEQGIYVKLVKLRQAKEKAHIDIIAYEQSPALAFQQGLPSALEIATEFQAKFASIWHDVHTLAIKDLDIK
jgi:hypothetical protein